MPRKINLKLILLILISPLILSAHISSAGQDATHSTYLPFISDDLSGWIGPYGGYIVCLAINPSNPQIVYAGTWGSGIYKSQDGGVSWQASNAGLGNFFINSLAIDPRKPSTLYAGTYRNQVYKSIDSGANWIWAGTGMQEQAIVYTLAIDPVTPSILYAGTRGVSNNGFPPWSGVVYRSSNAGNNWTPVLADVGGENYQDWVYGLAINPKSHGIIYAATHENGPFKSLDSGANWFSIDTGINDYSGRAVTINPGSPGGNTLYYGVWHNDSVYKTEDGGVNWNLSNNGVSFAQVYNIAIDTIKLETLYLATYNKGIYKTQNGGDTWEPDGLQDERVYTLAVNPSAPASLLAGTSGDGLYRSNDAGENWQPSNGGLDNAMLTAVLSSTSNPDQLYASVYGAGVLHRLQRGASWSEMNTGLQDKYVHALVQNPTQAGLIYALTDTGGLYRNNLSNSTGWVSYGVGLPLAVSNQLAYPEDHPFATIETESYATSTMIEPAQTQSTHAGLLTMFFAPSAPQTAYVGTVGYGVYKSSNAGSSWEPAGLTGESILSLAVDTTNANLVYAITDTPGSLKLSQNGGDTWTEANLPVTFYALATDPSSPGSVYAGSSNGIYRYKAGGWKHLGLASEPVTAIATTSAQPSLIYAGTTATAYYSVDGGLSWKPVSQSLNNVTVQSITIDSHHPNWAYFCTKTHGIYFATIRF